MPAGVPPATAALVAGGIAAAARGLGALTGGGAVAAWAVGTAVLAGTGWAGGLVLAAFFVPGTLVGRVVRPRTAPLVDPKGDCRDQWQVLANGGVAAVAAGAAAVSAAADGRRLALWLVTVSLAAAAADTWATAWGGRSRRPPRLVVGWRRVPPGTSGGVSLAGTAGAVAGALVVALAGAALTSGPGRTRRAALVVGLGVAGMLADSALGATLQGRFHCDRCDRPSDWPVHRCGARTRPTGGLPWLTNDVVNFLATLAAALAAAALWALGSAR
jgi:uncharacterized protein (TIGR00297 family)